MFRLRHDLGLPEPVLERALGDAELFSRLALCEMTLPNLVTQAVQNGRKCCRRS